MKKFKVSVVMSYWDMIEVEAETQEEAEAKAYDAFDISRARKGEGEIDDIAEVQV